MPARSKQEESLQDWVSNLPTAEGIRPIDQVPMLPAGQSRRAKFRSHLPPGTKLDVPAEQTVVTLVRDGDVLRWREGAIALAGSSTGRRGRAALPAGNVVQQFAFEKLDGSQVYSALIGLDRKLTPDAAYATDSNAGQPNTGLRRWINGRFQPFLNPREIEGKKVLLFIHGTFSNCESLLTNGLHQSADGRQLLTDATDPRNYDLVLAFDHPTLSVSPAMNAFDLAALLRPSPAKLDIVSHSRGGLVTRWFCEAFADPNLKRRAILVGSPLAGTSLAAAPRARAMMEYLTTLSNWLRTGTTLISAAGPLFMAVSGLLRVFSTVTNLAAKTPAFDVTFALVPGLDAQSRHGNNEEIRRLRRNTGHTIGSDDTTQYFAIQSNFEPTAIGWNFLRMFSKPMQRVADLGADLLFATSNDLVVDTASMTDVADKHVIPIAHDFGTSDTVHHLNYFHQPETIAAIRRTFGIV